MWQFDKKLAVVAVVCADLHLSATPPVARAGEPNWYAAMARPLEELGALAAFYEAPILCAGDVFDHWKAPPELINFAIDKMPKMHAIPGQHDLPFHNIGDIDKSAFGTLMRAGKLELVGPSGLVINGKRRLRVAGFGWGVPVEPVPEGWVDMPNVLNIALHHKYTWVPGRGYPGAPPEALLNTHTCPYPGFHVAVVGDNHRSFELTTRRHLENRPGVFFIHTNVFNCGGFMRRNADQLTHMPRVGLVCADGSVVPRPLSPLGEMFHGTTPATNGPAAIYGIENFLEELKGLHGTTLDYPAALRAVIARGGLSESVRYLLLQALEEVVE